MVEICSKESCRAVSIDTEVLLLGIIYVFGSGECTFFVIQALRTIHLAMTSLTLFLFSKGRLQMHFMAEL